MSNPASAAAVKAAPANREPTYSQMNVAQKGVFVLKVIAMLVTLGFAFPNILSK